jgi:hypothetical protein
MMMGMSAVWIQNFCHVRHVGLMIILFAISVHENVNSPVLTGIGMW